MPLCYQNPSPAGEPAAHDNPTMRATVGWVTIRHTFVVIAALASFLVAVGIDQPTAEAVGAVRCVDNSTGTVNAADSDGFNPIKPVRLVDTREGFAGHTGKVGGSCRVEIDLDDTPQIPEEATAVALSVIAVDATQRGFLTVHPCDSKRPATSNVNPRPNVPTPNQTITPIGPSRRICVFTNVATNIVVDATGWFGPSGQPFHERNPVRALDTRSAPRPDSGNGPVAAKTTYRLPMAGKWVPAEAKAVTVNLTVTGAERDGWALAYPCGSALPLASSVNYLRAEDRAGTTTVGLGPSGDLCLYSNQRTHMVVDVSAWYGGDSASHLEPLTGVRLVDSRNGIGGWTGRMAAGETRSFLVSGPGIDRYTHATALNVIATEATAPGHLRIFPCGGDVPLVSVVNFLPGDEATNFTMVPANDNRRVCVFANAPTHVVVDSFGVLTTGSRMRDLELSGPSSYPSADPTANDYALRCGAGDNNVTIDATPSPGATVRFGGDISNGPNPRKVTMRPDDLAKVTFRDNTGSEHFYVRCLPPTFPATIIDRPGEPSPGYYPVSHGVLVTTSNTPYVAIVDDHGVPLWYKETQAPVIGVHRRPDGRLAWSELLGGAYGVDPSRGWEIHNLDGSLQRVVKTVGSPTDHHELLRLDSGNDLAITYKIRTGVDMTGVDCKVLSGGSVPCGDVVTDLEIQELRPNGTVVWTWNSKDHTTPTESTQPFVLPDPNSPTNSAVDLFHANSVFEAGNGDLLVSARAMNAVFRINRNTGKIRWKLGGKPPTEPGAVDLQIVGDPFGGPVGQHDARIGDDGTITMFDNRTNPLVSNPGPSRAVAYDVDVAAGTATMVDELRRSDGRTTLGLGSYIRNADGSGIIGWGPFQPVIEEVDSDGDRVFGFTWQSGGPQYRAVKYGPGAWDANALRNNAGGTAEHP